MTLEKFVIELGDETQPLKHSGLLQLSGLASDDLFEFKSAWIQLPEPRKREILIKLVELGEDNLELDFGAIFRASLTDDSDEVREHAARGLWDSDDRVVIRPLLGLMTDDPAPNVRAAAAMALSKFAGMAQEGKLHTRDADRIRNALLDVIGRENEDKDVRRRCIEAVASFNTPEIGNIVQEAYESIDLSMKQSAIFAMGRTSDSQWLPMVLKETSAADPAIRFEAANAAGLLGDESTAPHLIALIRDDDSEVQVAAVEALGNIGGALALRALQQALKIGDDAVEEAAKVALENLAFDEDPLGFRYQ